ncbi:lipopolysaccharide biosynthesis protein [Emticicia agri]|uniref:Lipopolysaccharide biosynthesis protein n=1 Tax=Emticicia agri TaxID=2492393 RepID=A0A4Q5LXV6_9BACT|nr:lipopolysaccharide biosynthesis protein [Emticicia agri]RYU94353.1 lipopolysaccharide biosynthesis protein [Emticicia agri]
MERILLEKFAGKKIILFSVQTFNYEKIIADKLRSYNAEVFYFDERPSNSNFSKGIIRIKRSLYQQTIDKYYKDILQKVKNVDFDYLLAIRGEVIPGFFLEEFKLRNPKCKLIFYTWDAFANHNHALSILDYFDRKFTFDTNDANNYKIGFRPLFYIDDYKEVSYKSKNFYDVLFIGTAHSDRYLISNQISEWCKKHGFKSYNYYYMHGRLVYWYKRIFEKGFEKVNFRQLSFKSISQPQIITLYNQSRIILDIQHPNQSGLTMRTFEAIGAKKKIITTNKEISKYSFYNENNILIIDRNDIILNPDFFKTDFQEIDEKYYLAMSIDGWINEIFFDATSNFWINQFK